MPSVGFAGSSSQSMNGEKGGVVFGASIGLNS